VKPRILAVLGIATIAYFGGGTYLHAYLYDGQEYRFNRDSKINNTDYTNVIDEPRGDHVKPKVYIKAIFPIYVHNRDEERKKEELIT